MLGEITLTGLTTQGSLNNQIHSWRVGQILQAVAISRPAAERLQLRIGGVELEARTQAPIQAGDKVLLKVLSTGSTPTLQVVPATIAAAGAADIVNHAVRQLLPRQLSTDKVLSNLVEVLKQDSDQPRLPPQTRGLIETLLARIPSAEKLAEHTQLRQLMAESGLFRELHRHQGRSSSGFDIKQALIQLARQLAAAKPADSSPAARPGTAVERPAQQGALSAGVTAGQADSAGVAKTAVAGSRAPEAAPPPAAASGTVAKASPSPVAGATQPLKSEPAIPLPQQTPGAVVRQPNMPLQPLAAPEFVPLAELLQEVQRLVEGGIARIVLQQAQSMPQPEQGNLRWVFELPYRDGGEYYSLPMVIEREAKPDENEQMESGWRVELAFNLPELGSMKARILVRGEKVSASLWAERDSTAQLADTELPVLETALVASGLEVGALVCRHGQQLDAERSYPSSSMLDYRV